MRLNNHTSKSIKQTFLSVFEHGNIYLFSNRVDDNKKGGDIDLYLEVDDKTNLFEKKSNF